MAACLVPLGADRGIMSTDYLQRIMQRGGAQTSNPIAAARHAAQVPGGPALAAGAGTQPVVPTPPPLLAGPGAARDDDTEEGDMEQLRHTVVEGSQQTLHLTHIEHEGHAREVSCRVPRTGVPGTRVPAVPPAYPAYPRARVPAPCGCCNPTSPCPWCTPDQRAH